MRFDYSHLPSLLMTLRVDRCRLNWLSWVMSSSPSCHQRPVCFAGKRWFKCSSGLQPGNVSLKRKQRMGNWRSRDTPRRAWESVIGRRLKLNLHSTGCRRRRRRRSDDSDALLVPCRVVPHTPSSSIHAHFQRATGKTNRGVDLDSGAWSLCRESSRNHTRPQ